jgi:hypothetical protein
MPHSTLRSAISLVARDKSEWEDYPLALPPFNAVFTLKT